MTFLIFITAVAVFVCGAVTGMLTVLVAGIRSDDRSRNLTGVARGRTEAVTRRLLGVGVRDTRFRIEESLHEAVLSVQQDGDPR